MLLSKTKRETTYRYKQKDIKTSTSTSTEKTGPEDRSHLSLFQHLCQVGFRFPLVITVLLLLLFLVVHRRHFPIAATRTRGIVRLNWAILNGVPKSAGHSKFIVQTLGRLSMFPLGCFRGHQVFLYVLSTGIMERGISNWHIASVTITQRD